MFDVLLPDNCCINFIPFRLKFFSFLIKTLSLFLVVICSLGNYFHSNKNFYIIII
ncbi:hypothetical protein REIS_0182 [Rickettsia endosymbiont of Ixodes scapularis]|nr:hypothetical protein REIS_0182 [Rickettsia endosymbiont of Ixodes scapularis]